MCKDFPACLYTESEAGRHGKYMILTWCKDFPKGLDKTTIRGVSQAFRARVVRDRGQGSGDSWPRSFHIHSTSTEECEHDGTIR